MEKPVLGSLTGVAGLGVAAIWPPSYIDVDCRGATGLGSGPRMDLVKKEEWDHPKLYEDGKGAKWYQAGSCLHCQFGPALIHADGKETWAILAMVLTQEEIDVVKQILNDIKLAPLYINHPRYKYTAKWVLKDVKLIYEKHWTQTIVGYTGTGPHKEPDPPSSQNVIEPLVETKKIFPGHLTGAHSHGLFNKDPKRFQGVDDLLENPDLYGDGSGTMWYAVNGALHCPFGPAIVHADGREEWVVMGIKLTEEQIEIFKKIRKDIKLAPLYINDPALKYIAKQILKNGVETL